MIAAVSRCGPWLRRYGRALTTPAATNSPTPPHS